MIVMFFVYFVLFFIGICVGSFINAFEYRLYNGIDFLTKRSMCPKCKHKLGALDLVPLVSFAFIGGKCRYCGTKVSWQYPIVEFLSGMLFLASGCYVFERMQVLDLPTLLEMLLISNFVGLILSLFLFFALYDVKHKIVPNQVVIPTIIFVTILDLILAVGMHLDLFTSLLAIFENFNILWNVVTAVLGSLFIAFIIILTQGKGMGGGDLKLVFLMGLLLGVKKFIIAMYIAVILGSIVGVLWGFYKRKIRGLKIPFALFLSMGAILAFLWGEEIWSLFFNGI